MVRVCARRSLILQCNDLFMENALRIQGAEHAGMSQTPPGGDKKRVWIANLVPQMLLVITLHVILPRDPPEAWVEMRSTPPRASIPVTVAKSAQSFCHQRNNDGSARPVTGAPTPRVERYFCTNLYWCNAFCFGAGKK